MRRTWGLALLAVLSCGSARGGDDVSASPSRRGGGGVERTPPPAMLAPLSAQPIASQAVPAAPVRSVQAVTGSPPPLGSPPVYGPNLSEFAPSPEAEIYERARRDQSDPRHAIRARAAAQAAERHRRMATREFLGMSQARPTWSPIPYYGAPMPYYRPESFAYRSGSDVPTMPPAPPRSLGDCPEGVPGAGLAPPSVGQD